MDIVFHKYQGLGNDFVVVGPGQSVSTDEAVAICDRHLGVGADGVLLVALREGRPAMQVINADGSRPEMCGNGLRCVALYLREQGLVEVDRFEVDTGAGPHAVVVDGEQVQVKMAVPSLEPASLPVQAAESVIDASWNVDGHAMRLTAVSMGNPHAVTFDDVGELALKLGPLLETSARFPQGVNVGFAAMRGEDAIALRVWERGVGWTRACGTGACAAAVAAVVTGRAPRHKALRVSLPGGELRVEVGAPDEPVTMTGPARYVFEGRIALSRLRNAGGVKP